MMTTGKFLAVFLIGALALTQTSLGVEISVRIEVDSSGQLSDTWKEAIADRHKSGSLDSVIKGNKPLSPGEKEWLKLIQTLVPKVETQLREVERAFPKTTKPKRVSILVANRGGDDGFTYGNENICLDLSRWAAAYGKAALPENASRVVRIISHEYTHLLTKQWVKRHQVKLDSPFRRALWEAYYEGLGTYWSLSGKWHETGHLTQHSLNVIANLQNHFVSRFVALTAAPNAQRETELRVGLSTGNFADRWGSLLVALWLTKEIGNDHAKLAAWVDLGPRGVLLLADRNLPYFLRLALHPAYPLSEQSHQPVPVTTYHLNDNLSIEELDAATFVIDQRKVPVVIDGAKMTYQGNALLVRSGEHVILVDTPTREKDAVQVLGWIKRKYGKVKGWVINTHFHADSTGSNHVFKAAGFTVWASETTRDLLKIRGDAAILPTKTFPLQDLYKLSDSPEPIEIIFPGKSHAPDNIVVHFAQRKLLFGSCMVKLGDGLGYLGDADVISWRSAVKQLQDLNAQVVIPGHGSHYRPAILENTARLLDRELK